MVLGQKSTRAENVYLQFLELRFHQLAKLEFKAMNEAKNRLDHYEEYEIIIT